jgi:hypothetical protein
MKFLFGYLFKVGPQAMDRGGAGIDDTGGSND